MQDDFTSRSDSDLLAEYARSEAEEPFNELIRRYGALAYGTALRTLGEPANAEDAAQAAFLALLRKAKALPPDVCVAGWLQRAAFLAARDIRKLQRRRASHEREAAAKRQLTGAYRNSTAQLDAVDENLRGAIDAALAELPAVQRDTLVLRYLAGKTRSQVAETLACSEATVQTRINRARVRLREILQRKQIFPAAALAAWKAAIAPAAQPVASGMVAGIRNACFGPLVTSAAQNVSSRVLRRLVWDSAKLRVACGIAVAALGLCATLTWRAAFRPTVRTAPPVAAMAAPVAPAPPASRAVPVTPAPVLTAKAVSHEDEENDFEIGLRPALTAEAAQIASAAPPVKPIQPAEPPPLDLVLNIRETHTPQNPNLVSDAPEARKKAPHRVRTPVEETLTAELTRTSVTGASRFPAGTISGKILNLNSLHRP